jgi:hypothetical protein
VIAPSCEFYLEKETEVRILFDLRIPGCAERIHRERALWQEQSDIEALDENHFILAIRRRAADRRVALSRSIRSWTASKACVR